MKNIEEVQIGTLSPERFREALDDNRYAAFELAVGRARTILEGRIVWNINSTAKGGGVAEMLRSLLAYSRGAGIDARWLVIPGNPEFFRVTKRLHNHLHGAAGDGGELGPNEADIYEQALKPSLMDLERLVRPRDVVIVHDPQPGSLVGALVDLGALVFWRCHVGIDRPNHLARRAWNFLRPYISPAHVYVFSRRAFAWEALDDAKIRIVPPSIDAFSAKNQELHPDVVRSILATARVVAGDSKADPVFSRWGGAPGHVRRPAYMIEDDITPEDAEVVVQVSRWDRLKDPLGVIDGFVRHIAPHNDAHLILAGPSVQAVADDPEGGEVLKECENLWRRLPDEKRRRVHLACLPMEDGEENAAIVNAVQRRAAVVLQKSLAEGFGLTVAEAMWKGRPVVASRIGGIQDQIVDGVTGLLVDPADRAEFGAAVVELLNDPRRAEAMGRGAQQRVRDEFLGARHLMQYIDIIEAVS